MQDFTHEELQTVILRYDSKYKEAKEVITEKSETAQKLETELQAISQEFEDAKLTNEM